MRLLEVAQEGAAGRDRSLGAYGELRLGRQECPELRKVLIAAGSNSAEVVIETAQRGLGEGLLVVAQLVCGRM